MYNREPENEIVTDYVQLIYRAAPILKTVFSRTWAQGKKKHFEFNILSKNIY